MLRRNLLFLMQGPCSKHSELIPPLHLALLRHVRGYLTENKMYTGQAGNGITAFAHRKVALPNNFAQEPLSHFLTVTLGYKRKAGPQQKCCDPSISFIFRALELYLISCIDVAKMINPHIKSINLLKLLVSGLI